VQQGLPVVVTRNAATMPQERWNTEWVRQHGLGVVHRSFRTVRAAVAEIVARLPDYRARVGRVENRAVFEVPAIIEHLLAASHRMPASRVQGRPPVRELAPASPA
jgi:1,2-diacylglycerol 3-beta-galactosyltransferase